MMNWIYVIVYLLCSVTGSTLLKYGQAGNVKALFTVPFINMNVSLFSIIGFLFYGFSFGTFFEVGGSFADRKI